MIYVFTWGPDKAKAVEAGREEAAARGLKGRLVESPLPSSEKCTDDVVLIVWFWNPIELVAVYDYNSDNFLIVQGDDDSLLAEIAREKGEEGRHIQVIGKSGTITTYPKGAKQFYTTLVHVPLESEIVSLRFSDRYFGWLFGKRKMPKINKLQ